MATTAHDIIIGAVQEIGVQAPGEPLTDADARYGLDKLNDMLDSWCNENLAMFAQLSKSFPMVAGQVQYTIGLTGADITSTRPLKIIQAYLTDPQNNRYPIAIVQQYEFNGISNQLINGQIPNYLFYDPQNPLGIINIWPAPTLTWTITVLSYLQLVAFENLVQEVILPRGYVPALKTNLAIAIAPAFGQVPSPVTLELASRYLANIKRTNTVDIPARFDRELAVGSRGGLYNVRNDSFTGGWN